MNEPDHITKIRQQLKDVLDSVFECARTFDDHKGDADWVESAISNVIDAKIDEAIKKLSIKHMVDEAQRLKLP